jgi:hypothetical protein
MLDQSKIQSVLANITMVFVLPPGNQHCATLSCRVMIVGKWLKTGKRRADVHHPAAAIANM